MAQNNTRMKNLVKESLNNVLPVDGPRTPISGKYLQIKIDTIKHELDAVMRFYSEGDIGRAEEYLQDQITTIQKIIERLR